MLVRSLPYFLLLLLVTGCAAGRMPGPQPQGPESQTAPLPIRTEFSGHVADVDGPWLVVQNGDQLTAHNLDTGKSVAIPTRGPLWGGYAVGGGKAVWSDLRNDPHVSGIQEQQTQPNLWNWDVMVMDLATGDVRQVTQNAGAQLQPHTDGRSIVWEDFREDTSRDYYGYPEIYVYDLAAEKERPLTRGKGGHFQPRVDGDTVVWMDGRNNPKTGGARGCENCPENNWDIFGVSLSKNREFSVATEAVMENSPDVAGDRVVWVELRDGGQVWLLDLKTKERRRLTSAAAVRNHVRIDGDLVVWEDERRGHGTNDVVVNGLAGNADIFLYDLTEKAEARLTGDWIQLSPAISKRTVAFIYSTQVNPKVQVVEVPMPSHAPPP